jgi:hypothetical protein
MENKNREKMLLIAVGVCVALWVLNYVVITPVFHAWKTRQAKITDLRDTIKDGRTIQGSAKSIEDQWEHMRTNTLSTNATHQEDQLYKAFQTWSTSSGVVLVGQKPQPKDSDDPEYANEELHVDVTGTLNQIFNFLYCVEAGPLGLKVDSIELSTRDDRGQQLALGLILTPTNDVANR